MTTDETAPSVRGLVKWFDPAKGFGFVVSDEGGADILLHANVLRSFGQSSVADGAGIEITVARTERGVQAVTVLSIEPPVTDSTMPLADLADIDPEDLKRRPLLPARVKWFDKSKGFGFANVFGRDEDIFIHIEVLRRSGLSDLAPGEAICLRNYDGRRGKMAVEIAAWEAGVRLQAGMFSDMGDEDREGEASAAPLHNGLDRESDIADS